MASRKRWWLSSHSGSRRRDEKRLLIRRRARRLAFESLQQRRVLAAFLVNSAGDESDSDLGDHVCSVDASGLCTLRAAIQTANVEAGRDEIKFSVPVVAP